ncbi:hypothetical protein FRC10_000226 [Ceratobasidium sp. 414]|nr:hypothetical protein FRC10_000226 [Ceratobasidium sp. 414]
MNPYKADVSCIPELLQLVCEYSTGATCVQIAYSSRFFFRVATPYVWKELRGAHNLLSLVPGVEISCNREKTHEIILPDNTPPNLSRYHIYAPLVHSLKVFETPSHSYKVSTWATLSGYSDCLGGALLPNLKQLVIHCERCPLADRVNWIAMFLAPSLLEMQFLAGPVDHVLEIPDSRASALFELIAQRCPSVQTLSLFPEPDDHYDSPGEDVIPFAPATMSHEHVASMRCLRALTMGKYILQHDALISIGLLPALEKLEVQETVSEPTFIVSSAQLPEYLFPSLRHLTLQMINSFEVAQIWQMVPLVGRLTHVQINAIPPELEFLQDEEDSLGLIHYLPQLFQNSSQVQSLSINFDVEALSDLEHQSLNILALASTLQLPLQSLALSAVEIGDFNVFRKRLMGSCSNLRQLQIPDQMLSLPELAQLTHHLKRLEHLSVDVGWFDLPEPEEQLWAYSSDALISLEYNSSDPTGFAADPDVSAKDIAM